MTSWLALALAILFEITGTLALRIAVSGRRWCFAVVVGAYGAAFTALSIALAAGVPVGVAYGIWAATGVAATAILSRVLFAEPLTAIMATGVGLIVVGVLLVEIGGR
jgi:small multidrug resistance pump